MAPPPFYLNKSVILLTRQVFSVCNDDDLIQFKVPPLRGQQLYLSLSNDATQATKHINF
ncbi:hypothetical protein CBM2633_P240006 [Cupriavidus taiwanensis]|uniref:Uncharacterized protein n=2 Tax=Cupriavidus TaxID=106589 RepID=A0A375FAI4_9BURK|nr:hypothetical protein CBM2592_P270006 [Cupriavidus taiwanensis]SOZ40532.1 hypothetical protein CBM2605_P240005 [Cupriavidus neocaledonicus]SOY75275.1 hypothetical protein CBM2585_P240005 [Cupriavidus taiwanensis]SOY75300.1 hypothetical protein CBM2588_P270006 [Cupriavidus taiwanensis]SOY75895.1 hypothetical protein CBM2589_P250005 [Cupriavidus taiwanensis]